MKPALARLVLIAAVLCVAGIILLYRLLAVSSAAGWQHEVFLRDIEGASGLAIIGDTLYVSQEFLDYQGGILAVKEGSRQQVVSSLQKPDGLAVWNEQLIYTQEFGVHAVYEFDGRQSIPLFKSDSAEGVDVDAGGDVYVVEDRPNGRLLKYSRHDGTVRVLAGELEEAEGLCVMGSDIYFSEKAEGAIYRIDRNGKSRFLSGLSKPGFLHCDEPGGWIWITEDRQNFGRLLRSDTAGNVAAVATSLKSPQSIVFAGNDSILLAEQGRGRILRFRPDTTGMSGNR